MIVHAVLVIGFSLGLLSCTIGPDYQRPTTEMEDRFRMAGASADLPSLANVSWWELLRDEQLQQLIRTALVENMNLQQAVATVEEFRARALIARSDYFPGVTVAASAPAGRKANFLFPGFASPFNYYLVGNLAWEVDLWGRVKTGATQFYSGLVVHLVLDWSARNNLNYTPKVTHRLFHICG